MNSLVQAACIALLPATALAEPVVLSAEGTVPETVDRLRTSIENAGAVVFKVIDFGSGARAVGSDIGDVQLVIFGDPRIGAAALSQDPMPALDLPAKILVYRSHAGTQVAYERPAEMLAEWDVAANTGLMQKMSSLLDSIADVAR